jgi:GntR family transcriptional regulator / MocR family aminotransferase
VPKIVGSLDLTLNSRRPNQSLTDWLYRELRRAIVEGRLPPGTRLPASRDFAQQHDLSRGTVVSVMERLQTEGYLNSRVGSGTWVNRGVGADNPVPGKAVTPPPYIRRVISAYARPKAFIGLARANAALFRCEIPLLQSFRRSCGDR